MQDLDVLRYPVGQFNHERAIPFEEVKQHIDEIDQFPVKLTELVGKWSDDRLDTAYRPGGWTVRQLVHHIADSHINAYVRTKLALTEDNPTIKPYEQDEWARLTDATLDVAPSLVILRNLHQRWVVILSGLTREDLQRTYFHPESGRSVPLSEMIGNYAWHGEHHYQHIHQLAERNGWFEKNV